MTSLNGTLVIDVPEATGDVVYTQAGAEVLSFNAVAETLDSHTDSLESHSGRLDSHQTELNAHGSAIDALEDDVSAVTSRVSASETDIASLQDDVVSLGQDIVTSNTDARSYTDQRVAVQSSRADSLNASVIANAAATAQVQTNLNAATSSLGTQITNGDQASQTATTNVLNELRAAEACGLAGQAYHQPTGTCRNVRSLYHKPSHLTGQLYCCRERYGRLHERQPGSSPLRRVIQAVASSYVLGQHDLIAAVLQWRAVAQCECTSVGL
jgi:hypothetical protein